MKRPMSYANTLFMVCAFFILSNAQAQAQGKAIEETFADRKGSLEIGSNDESISCSFKIGSSPGKAVISFKDAPKLSLNFKVASPEIKIDMANSKKKESARIENFQLDNQYIAISGLRQGWNIEVYARPNLERYPKTMKLELIKKWTEIQGASDHFLNFELRLDSAGFELWIDGRYCGRNDGPRPISLNVELGKGGALSALVAQDKKRSENYLPLDVSFIGTAKLNNAKLPYKPGSIEIEGIPMIVSADKAADLGEVRHVPKWSVQEEEDAYLARAPLDGMPETFHYSVPANQYAYAHVLCTVDDDPQKYPEFTARISRFVAYRGVSSDAIMDSSIKLPRFGEKLPPGVKMLGEISYEREGKNIKSPLYLVSLPLKTGSITDMVFQPHASPMLKKEPYLDFEIIGRKRACHQFGNHAPYPDNNIKISVKILGLTLERSPVEMELRREQLGNIFHNDEKPGIGVELRAQRKCGCSLEWNILDYDGKNVGSGSKEFSLDTGAKEKFRIPMEKLEPGWYAISVKLSEGKKLLIEIPAAAAILGKDTRKAGAESPYASRTASVMQPPTPEINAILMQKAGIRGITPMVKELQVGEEVYSKWNIHGFQIPWGILFRDMKDPAGGKTEEEKRSRIAVAEIEIEKRIRDYLAKYPSAKAALIFHESGGGPFPPELFDGEAPKQSAEDIKKDQANFLKGVLVAKIYREKFPQIRLIVGNCGPSLGMIAGMMRMKFPKEYIDALGEESLGQNKMPETPTYEYGNGAAINAWYMKQLALKMGYGELPLDACSEWRGRLTTDLGDRTKAEWDMRDLLIAYAYGYKIIRTPDITDQASMYYDTEYGSQGALRRYPLLYPKPSYVATSTMTKVLDCVQYVRKVPLESNTVYVLEFKRYGKEYVYAFWLPRSAAELSFEFGKDTDLVHVGMLGKESVLKTKGGKITLLASSGPSYLISTEAVKRVSRVKEIPDSVPSYFVANAMDKASDWQILPRDEKLTGKRSPTNYYGVKGGDFELSEVKDPEKGKCLKLELKSPADDPAACVGSIKLNTSVEIPGKPNTIALMVKGNSSWSRVTFEFEDAEGEIYRSTGVDWPANLSVNFDGWHLLRFPINDAAKWPHHIYPNWISSYWSRSGKAGNKKVDYPIKLVGISVKMPRKVFVLTEFKDLKEPELCFRDFGAYDDSEQK